MHLSPLRTAAGRIPPFPVEEGRVSEPYGLLLSIYLDADDGRADDGRTPVHPFHVKHLAGTEVTFAVGACTSLVQSDLAMVPKRRRRNGRPRCRLSRSSGVRPSPMIGCARARMSGSSVATDASGWS